MKNCPVCNELLGDNAEKCIYCKYEFPKKVYLCCKCGKQLNDAKSSCECGGWATGYTNASQYQEYCNSDFSWTRDELKSRAKLKLRPILLLAIIACLFMYLFSGSNFSIKRANTNITYDENQKKMIISYYNNDIKAYTIVENFNEIPAYLTMRAGWKTFTLWEVASVSPTSLVLKIYFYIFLILIFGGLFVYSPYQVGVNRFFMKNIYGKADFKAVFFGFRHYLAVTGKMFIMNLKLVLWFLLLVVPGIVKSYEYMMVPYLLSENPDISMRDAFQLSRDMMDGNKWNVFVLDLSFVLWNALSYLTLGIAGILWVMPYTLATRAELYNYFRSYFIKYRQVSNTILKGFED